MQKVGAIVIKDRKVLAVRSNKGELFLSLGGQIDEGETHEECLRREIKEELDADLVNMEYFGEVEDIAPYEKIPIKIYFYLSKIKGNLKPKTEIKEFRWIDSSYKKNGIKLGFGLEKFVIPKLLEMKLID